MDVRSFALVMLGAALAAGVIVGIWQPWQEDEPSNEGVTAREELTSQQAATATPTEASAATPRACQAYELFKSAQSEYLERELLTDALVCAASFPEEQQCSALLELLETADSREAEVTIHVIAEAPAWGCLGPMQPRQRTITELSEEEILAEIDVLFSACMRGTNDPDFCQDAARLPLEQQWCRANPESSLCTEDRP